MANILNGYLSNNNTAPDLRDWQHAARLFSDNNQVYGPKQKFLFHVAISINPNALATPVLNNNYRTVLGMLVKSVTLPKFTAQIDKANQYNRKKNIQQKITYEDITLKFHDDNMGVINLMWQNYFNYYYADSSSARLAGAFNRTATRNFSFTRSAYGLDSGSTDPFFNYITVYQMAQGTYVSYKLINPIIASWSHETVDYSQSQQPHDNVMTLSFEAVEYGSGEVVPGDPEGWGQEFYDKSTSPLINPLAVSVPKDTYSPNNLLQADMTQNNSSNFLNNAVQTVNNYQNTNSAVPTSPTGTPGLTTVPSTSNTVGNTNFPGTSTNTTTTSAMPITISPGQ